MPATIFVLFGATGDLSKRLVLPAFFTLAQRGLLPAEWRLVGNGRGDHPHEHFRASVRSALEEFGPHPDEGPWEEVQERLLFAGGGFDSDDPGSLLDILAEVREELGEDAQLIHYLALPPTVFEQVTEALAAHGLTDGARVVYEKPFGTSPDSFRSLDDAVRGVLTEEQVFRIDHFLGKEATQDLHVLRYGNRLFDGVWSSEHVAEVQIDVPETLDIDDRALFYDATGAARDMLVTHLFQVAAEIAMEPPATLDAEDLQTARESVIACFRPLAKEDVVLGQYEGYLDVEGVEEGSTTDTFVAARLWVDTDRWRGVPFLLRTGKRLSVSRQQVSLVMKPVDGPVTETVPGGNTIRISMSGDGRLDLDLVVKRPGPDTVLASGTASLDLDDVLGGQPLPAYSSLLHDVMTGDRSLFTTSDGLHSAWACFAPLMADPPSVQTYPQGSWGPAAAGDLSQAGWVLGQG